MSLHLSKYHIVGNRMSRLIYYILVLYLGFALTYFSHISLKECIGSVVRALKLGLLVGDSLPAESLCCVLEQNP